MGVYLHKIVTNLDFWGILGLTAQAVFAARFIVQWIASEKRGESTIPMAFWYLSIVGSLGTLVYGFGKGELPVILGQLPGTLVYVRNVVLIKRKARQATAAAAAAASLPAARVPTAPEPLVAGALPAGARPPFASAAGE